MHDDDNDDDDDMSSLPDKVWISSCVTLCSLSQTI